MEEQTSCPTCQGKKYIPFNAVYAKDKQRTCPRCSGLGIVRARPNTDEQPKTGTKKQPVRVRNELTAALPPTACYSSSTRLFFLIRKEKDC